MKPKHILGQRMAYAFSGFGQAAFYNMMSTYFVVYVTSALFAGVNKDIATKLVGIITGAIVLIRIGEIFIDPLLGNLIDNTNTRIGRFRPWQFIGGLVSAILLFRHGLSFCSLRCSSSSTCSIPCVTSRSGA